MINLRYSVTYPKVARASYPEPEREYRGSVPLSNDSVPREKVCDVLFAGFGNHPGNEQDLGFPGYVFTTGNGSIDFVHQRWVIARTRSMSVGDVVNFENSDIYYICDSCGWFSVFKDQARRWLDFPRQYGCCSFELKQWKKAEGLDN